MKLEPTRAEEFLAKAREAEAQAAKVTAATVKSAWTIVARDYRELAAACSQIDQNKERS